MDQATTDRCNNVIARTGEVAIRATELQITRPPISREVRLRDGTGTFCEPAVIFVTLSIPTSWKSCG